MGQRLIRKENWPILLENEIKKHVSTTFKYGKHDCCYAVNKCVTAMTGINAASMFRKFASAKESLLMREEFGDICGIAEFIAKEFNLREIPILKATAGDLVVIKDPLNEECLGIVGLDGRNVYTAAKPKGWISFPLSLSIKAWRI